MKYTPLFILRISVCMHTTKKSFSKAPRQYTHHKTILKAGKKVDQLMKSAGYLLRDLRAEHVAKPRDSETA